MEKPLHIPVVYNTNTDMNTFYVIYLTITKG